MAHSVHKGEDKAHKVGCDERALFDRRGRTLDALAQFWDAWTKPGQQIVFHIKRDLAE